MEALLTPTKELLVFLLKPKTPMLRGEQSLVETLEPLAGPRTGAALRRAFTELFRVYVDAMCRAFEEHQTADGPFIETLGQLSVSLPPPELWVFLRMAV